MENSFYYTGVVIEYGDEHTDDGTDTVRYTEKLHDALNEAKYELNFMISCFVSDKFGIFLTDEYLFLYNPLNVSAQGNTSSISIIGKDNIKKCVIFVKKGLTIDIFIESKTKGFLYNGNSRKHLYKFFIIKNSLTAKQENLPTFVNPSDIVCRIEKIKQTKIVNQFITGTPIKSDNTEPEYHGNENFVNTEPEENSVNTAAQENFVNIEPDKVERDDKSFESIINSINFELDEFDKDPFLSELKSVLKKRNTD